MTLRCWKLIWRHGIIGQCVKLLEKNSGDKMFARNVELLLQNSDDKHNSRILEQPLARIVLLLEAEYVNFPTKQALNYGKRVELFVGRQL